MMSKFLLVALAGGIGCAFRFGVSELLNCGGLRFPWATFLVNFVGALLIGILIRNIAQGSTLYYLGVVGFCGGFTTFSAFSLEVVRLLKQGDLALAMTYAILSVVVCVVAVYIGMKLKF